MPEACRAARKAAAEAASRIGLVIARYSRPAMTRVWSDERKLERMLEVELAALDGWASLGVVPADAVERIRERARAPSPERVAALERETGHDVAAFVDAVAETLGDDGRWLHYGLTSSDVIDTALSLAVQEAGALVLDGVERAFEAVVARAEEHRETVCMGRTHGVHAEPTTFGLKLVGWAFALERDRQRVATPGAGQPQAARGGGPVRRDRPRGGARRVRATRGRAGPQLDPDPPARPACGAPVGARAAGVVARALLDGDPPPRSNRGS